MEEKELNEEFKQIELNILNKIKNDVILKELQDLKNPPITKEDILEEPDKLKRLNLIAEHLHLFE